MSIGRSSSSPSSSSAAAKGKGITRVRPAAVRPPANSGFSPSFPALDEDPAGLRMDGWLALEEDSAALISRYEVQRRVVLVLGRPTPAAVEQLVGTSSQATLLILPKPSSNAAPSSPKPPSRTVYLRTTVAEAGLGKVFEEAIGHAIKWKKACPTRRPQSWMGSASSRRNSSKETTASPAAAASSLSSTATAGRSDRPLDVVLHFVHEQSQPSPPTASAPAPPSSFKPTHTRASQSVHLQGMLSAAFLVTSATVPFLATRSSSGLSSPSSSTLRRPAPAVINSRPSSVHSSSSSSSLANLPTSALPPRAITDSGGGLRGALGSPPDAVLVHVLPDNMPPLLPHLLDGFIQTFVKSTPSVMMAVVPHALLGAQPEVHHDPPHSAQTARPTPTILQLLLASAIRPPLPPLPPPGARSRRDSSSSATQSSRSSAASGLSTKPTEDLHTYISAPSDVSFVPRSSVWPSPTGVPIAVVTPPSPHAATFDPRSTEHAPVPDLVASSSSSSASDDTSLPPPSASDSKSLEARTSFASLPTAGVPAERQSRSRKGGFWSRMFGRNSSSPAPVRS